jgi:hypothetical protein
MSDFSNIVDNRKEIYNVNDTNLFCKELDEMNLSPHYKDAFIKLHQKLNSIVKEKNLLIEQQVALISDLKTNLSGKKTECDVAKTMHSSLKNEYAFL